MHFEYHKWDLVSLYSIVTEYLGTQQVNALSGDLPGELMHCSVTEAVQDQVNG